MKTEIFIIIRNTSVIIIDDDVFIDASGALNASQAIYKLAS